MNWAWAGSIEQLWRSPNFPMWLALAAAGFFGIVVLVALSDKEVSDLLLYVACTRAVSGLTTGLRDVDSKLGGLHPSDLMTLAGRPGMGKTALAMVCCASASP